MYTLDEYEAFEAMRRFLKGFYERGHAEDSDLNFLLAMIDVEEDGCTADPAAWGDWVDAVCSVKRGVDPSTSI